MIFTIWYRSKVLTVLKLDFDSIPSVPGKQSRIFNRITKDIKRRGGNEYDGALAFLFFHIHLIRGDKIEDQYEWASNMRAKMVPLQYKCKVYDYYSDPKWALDFLPESERIRMGKNSSK